VVIGSLSFGRGVSMKRAESAAPFLKRCLDKTLGSKVTRLETAVILALMAALMFYALKDMRGVF
jgi:hypothetical protein